MCLRTYTYSLPIRNSGSYENAAITLWFPTYRRCRENYQCRLLFSAKVAALTSRRVILATYIFHTIFYSRFVLESDLSCAVNDHMSSYKVQEANRGLWLCSVNRSNDRATDATCRSIVSNTVTKMSPYNAVDNATVWNTSTVNLLWVRTNCNVRKPSGSLKVSRIHHGAHSHPVPEQFGLLETSPIP